MNPVLPAVALGALDYVLDANVKKAIILTGAAYLVLVWFKRRCSASN